MDKTTLSHYGWIVVLTLVLACLLGFSAPFALFVADGFKATYAAFGFTSDKALETAIGNAVTPPTGTEDPADPPAEPTVYYIQSLKAHNNGCNCDCENTHNLTTSEDLPAYIIAEEAVKNYYKVNDGWDTVTVNDEDFRNYKLCGDILDHCTIQKIRYTAMSILSVLYINDELIDKAKEMCEQFPESVYDTVSEQYEQLYCRCDNAKYVEFVKKNLRYTAEHLINKIRNFGTFATHSIEQKIMAYGKCLELIDLIYDDGDYGFACYHVGHINCLIAKLYHELKDSEKAVEHLEKGLHFSKVYDELPKKVKHTSFLLKDDMEDLSEVSNGTQMNRVAYEISEFRKVSSSGIFSKEIEDILEDYTRFAKEN